MCSLDDANHLPLFAAHQHPLPPAVTLSVPCYPYGQPCYPYGQPCYPYGQPCYPYSRGVAAFRVAGTGLGDSPPHPQLPETLHAAAGAALSTVFAAARPRGG
eukprot:gene49991-42188_t